MVRVITPRKSLSPTVRFLVTVDRRKARLLRVESAPGGGGGERTVVADTIAEKWIEKEHGRPMMLSPGGTRLSAGRDEERERAARFSRTVSDWLESALERCSDRIDVYCTPALFGTLRGVVPTRLHERLEIHRRNLANVSPARASALTRRERRSFEPRPRK